MATLAPNCTLNGLPLVPSAFAVVCNPANDLIESQAVEEMTNLFSRVTGRTFYAIPDVLWLRGSELHANAAFEAQATTSRAPIILGQCPEVLAQLGAPRDVQETCRELMEASNIKDRPPSIRIASVGPALVVMANTHAAWVGAFCLLQRMIDRSVLRANDEANQEIELGNWDLSFVGEDNCRVTDLATHLSFKDAIWKCTSRWECYEPSTKE